MRGGRGLLPLALVHALLRGAAGAKQLMNLEHVDTIDIGVRRGTVTQYQIIKTKQIPLIIRQPTTLILPRRGAPRSPASRAAGGV